MTKLAIITACTRAENIPAMYASIIDNKPTELDIEWLIVNDAHVQDVNHIYEAMFGIDRHDDITITVFDYLAHVEVERAGGQAIKDVGIDLVTDAMALVYFLDDDTRLHKNFYSELMRNQNFDIILGAQEVNGMIRMPKPKASFIDQGQYIVRRGIIRDYRIPHHYMGDGEFIETLCKRTPVDTQVMCGVISTYNALR